jgi:putative ABC transport system permease protein
MRNSRRIHFKPQLWLIRVIGVIVPRRLRADWRQEWEAELRYREEFLADWERLDWRNKLDLLRRSVGAFWDALLLQPRRLEDEMFQDLRFGARMLLKRPGFTLMAALTLALGIGANTALFSAVNTVLLRPLPLPEPDRLMTFWHSAPAKGLPEVMLNDALFAFYRDHSQMFEKLAAYESARYTLTGAGDPELLVGARVTFDYFQTLGQEPLRGRVFLPQEDAPGKNNVVVLSYGLWQRRFGGDPEIVGQAIKLDDFPMIVVGVMPPGFDFPNPAERIGMSDHMQIWVPYGLNPQFFNSWNLSTIGRLKPGVTPAAAQRELAALWDDFARQYEPQLGAMTLGAGATTVVTPLDQRIAREVRTPLLALLGAVAFVLLIACANLANLLLAKAASRSRELAMRQCLGASAQRIARQLLTESLLLALLGAAGGLALAAWSVNALKGLSSANVPRIELIRLDWTALLFAIAVTLLTGVLCGLAPALLSARANLQAAIKEGARGSASVSNRRLNNAFVVAQLALSMVLLIGAALLLQSFKNLLDVNPGFRPENVLMGKILLPESRYDNNAQVRSFYERSLERVRGLPGVQAAESSQAPPFSGDSLGATFMVEGQEPKVGEPAKAAQLRDATPGYFASMGMPILKGRSFQTSDTETSPPVAIVDEKLAHMQWPNGDPIGQRISIGGSPMMTIVGVVPSVKYRNLNEETDPYVYRPATQFVRWATTLVVRTTIDPTALIPAIQRQVASLDPELPLYHVSTIEQGMARSLRAKRLTNLLLTGFAMTALLLALIGIYGVMSLNVGGRTNEFGIRLALGARGADVLWLVVGQGMRLTLTGVALGLGGAFGLTRMLESLLFGVKATDPPIFAGVAVVLCLAALTACYIPARRATKVDPLVALRQE